MQTCPTLTYSHANASGNARIVPSARAWLGTPYRHQMSLRGVGCDCLGLVRGVWRDLYGAEPEMLPAYSSDWAEASRSEPLLDAARRHLVECPVDALQPGHVLVFRWRPHLPAKHCGILTEPGRMIHAYDAAGLVAEGALASAWRARIAGVFRFP